MQLCLLIKKTGRNAEQKHQKPIGDGKAKQNVSLGGGEGDSLKMSESDGIDTIL